MWGDGGCEFLSLLSAARRAHRRNRDSADSPIWREPDRLINSSVGADAALPAERLNEVIPSIRYENIAEVRRSMSDGREEREELEKRREQEKRGNREE